MDKSDKPYRLLIQKYTANILEYTNGISEQEFVESSLVYDARISNFMNIGEQMKSLSQSFVKRYPKISYRKIIGLRNIAAHSYEGLEAFRLFKVVDQNIPSIHEQISTILKSSHFD